ncbi:hypothetical protein SAMN04487969_102470 [Paenibacillus algorifonticola]|uniref:Uncharacterized protein n=1 Tax=Paenibacillus algorifonticola TaxID=684063 RepID=A0A1I2AJ02_9BACL|nr:hypothetical protein [Paenibacillus algorifonticola]SFE42810.1 hypothetical protein SAMN04487969_102470 [Paenibacillus algorifonticola]
MKNEAVSLVNDYSRLTMISQSDVHHKVYDILLKQHGIDVRQRVANERERINAEHYSKKGKRYSESTLKSKVNGIDVMVRDGVLDRFNAILVGLLAAEKDRSLPVAP